MADLRTTYLGLPLRTPLVASAGPVTGDLDRLRAVEAAGISAVVLPSLFEEEILGEQEAVNSLLDRAAGANPEAAGGYFANVEHAWESSTTRYLRHLSDARDALEVPVIASLNGTTRGGWVRYARMLVDAGADAIELNVYRVVADVDTTAHRVEQELLELVRAIVSEVTIPVAVKLSPFYTAFAHTAAQLVGAGAAGLVLFNRFYQPDIDLESLDVVPQLELSHSTDVLLPMRWLALLHGRVDADLAATSGIHTGHDALKVLLAGATVACMTSALLRNGPDHVADVERELDTWMEDRAYVSVDQLRGSVSSAAAADPSAYERANYVRTLTTSARLFR